MYWKRNHQSDEEFEETLRQNYANKIQGSKVRTYIHSHIVFAILCIRIIFKYLYLLLSSIFYFYF